MLTCSPEYRNTKNNIQFARLKNHKNNQQNIKISKKKKNTDDGIRKALKANNKT